MNKIKGILQVFGGGFLIYMLIIFLQYNFGSDVDNDVALGSGTLISYRWVVLKRNYVPVSEIDGKMVAIRTWNISYIDKNNVLGTCEYYESKSQKSIMSDRINQPIKCSTGKVVFGI